MRTRGLITGGYNKVNEVAVGEALKTIAGESTAHNFRASDACVFVKSYLFPRLSTTVTYCRAKRVYTVYS